MGYRIGSHGLMVDPGTDKPIGPAMKHVAERAQVAESGPGAESWPRSEWSKAALTGFPMNSLAAALDQAEA